MIFKMDFPLAPGKRSYLLVMRHGKTYWVDDLSVQTRAFPECGCWPERIIDVGFWDNTITDDMLQDLWF